MTYLKESLSFFRKYQQDLSAFFEKRQMWRVAPNALMAAVIVLTSTLMFPSSETFQFINLSVGRIYTGKEVIAPFTFLVNKSQAEIDSDRKSAAEEIPLVFSRSDSIETVALRRFDEFYREISEVRAADLSDSLRLSRSSNVFSDYFIIMEPTNIPFFLKSETNIEPNRQENRSVEANVSAGFDELRRNLRRILADIYAIGILDLTDAAFPPYASRTSVVTRERESIDEIDNYFKLSNYQDAVVERLVQTYEEQTIDVNMGFRVLNAFLSPNVIFDKVETDRRISDAVANVPLSKGIVLENERIISTHEKITQESLEKLTSLAKAKADRELRDSGGFSLVLPYLGKVIIICLALSFIGIFLQKWRKEIFHNTKKMVMLFVIFLIVITATFIINQFDFSTNLKYLIPIAIASMLLTIFFDSRTGFIGTVSLSIIIGALRGNDFGLMLISLFVGTMSTFSIREIQARAWILKGTIMISVSYFFAIAAVEFLKLTEVNVIAGSWFYGLINGLFSPMLTYLLMIIFEYVFKMTTNSTLLELSDLNKPLLRQLAIRAPGTYHHSIMVGNLSEAASESIGANALLTRVASYYHDIGKMEKPEYFVENQKGGKNPHEKLTPNMSCLILINHVKKGLEIAHEYKLPKEICDFIPQHHGTNIIRFFYEKAKESNTDGEINEADYRYNGPKPQTQETAIVMLADAVEAGSRTLKDPSVSRIRSMINSFVHERLLDEELDECPLTLRDLHLIKESFVNTLTGMFHGRIEYPSNNLKFFRKKKKEVY